MKTLLLLFVIAFLWLLTQANPVVKSLADIIESQLNNDDGKIMATITCYGRKGLCQHWNRPCPSNYVWPQSVNNCMYPHVNKCCVL